MDTRNLNVKLTVTFDVNSDPEVQYKVKYLSQNPDPYNGPTLEMQRMILLGMLRTVEQQILADNGNNVSSPHWATSCPY